MMTSLCRTCGGTKAAAEYGDNHCGTCMSAVAGAQAAAAAEGKDIEEARRLVLQSRAHNSRRNYVDPRAVDRRTMWNYGNMPGAIPTEGASD